jgi:hypothetical protein
MSKTSGPKFCGQPQKSGGDFLSVNVKVLSPGEMLYLAREARMDYQTKRITEVSNPDTAKTVDLICAMIDGACKRMTSEANWERLKASLAPGNTVAIRTAETGTALLQSLALILALILALMPCARSPAAGRRLRRPGNCREGV